MGNAQTVGRLQAVDGNQLSGGIPGGSCSIVVHNPLAAPIYILFGQGVPSASSFDLAVPGAALLAYPIPDDATTLSAIVRYPGAVPAADAGQHATILVTRSNQGTSVGPLA